MAQALLQLLMDVAGRRGLTELTAQVQRENHGMIALFRRAGASVHSVIGADAVDVRLPVHPTSS
jgi:ribosomal protein S18 acetylase RimI-like enzyme